MRMVFRLLRKICALLVLSPVALATSATLCHSSVKASTVCLIYSRVMSEKITGSRINGSLNRLLPFFFEIYYICVVLYVLVGIIFDVRRQRGLHVVRVVVDVVVFQDRVNAFSLLLPALIGTCCLGR